MTIKSRCIKISISLPDEAVATDWLLAQSSQKANNTEDIKSLLKIAGGAPLLTLKLLSDGFLDVKKQLLEDVVNIAKQKQSYGACAKKWKETGSELCLMWFQSFLSDLVKLNMTDNGLYTLANMELKSGLQLPKKALNLRQLFDFIDVVSESKKLLNAPMDEQLLLEDILIRWQGLTRS